MSGVVSPASFLFGFRRDSDLPGYGSITFGPIEIGVSSEWCGDGVAQALFTTVSSRYSVAGPLLKACNNYLTQGFQNARCTFDNAWIQDWVQICIRRHRG